MSLAPSNDQTGPRQPNRDILHASSVALGKRALLISGPPGSGKSELALALMALGAGLIADDRTIVTRQPGGGLLASCPPALSGMIEARGLGVLTAEPGKPAYVTAMVDLGVEQTERLPPLRMVEILGREVPLIQKIASHHFPALLLQYLKGGNRAE